MSLNDLFGQRRTELGIEPEQSYKAPLTLFTDDKRDTEFMGKAAKWATKALHGRAAQLNAMEVGDGKNNYLNKSTWVLLRFALAGHLDVQEVIDVMGEADGGGQYPATRTTLRSAYQGALKHGPADPPIGQNVSTDDFFDQLVAAARVDATGEIHEKPLDAIDSPTSGDEAGPQEAQTATETDAEALSRLVREKLPLIVWQKLWDDTSEEEWIIEPILPARRLIALYSPPKVGKSLLLLELCCAITTGRDVLGVSIDRPRRVLYVDFENDPKADIRERLQAMNYGPRDLDNLCYLSFPTIAAFDSMRGGQELMAAISEYQCEVVVVDTVSRAVEGEENENDTWLNFYRHTGLLLKQAGVALIRLDHSGKDETKGQRGGSAKSGDVDAVWRLSRVADEVYRLDCEAARFPVAEKTLVLHREQAPLRHRIDAAGRAAAVDIQIEHALTMLTKYSVPVDLGRDKARAELKKHGVKVSNLGLSGAIKRRQDLSAEAADRWSD